MKYSYIRDSVIDIIISKAINSDNISSSNGYKRERERESSSSSRSRRYFSFI